MSNIDKQALREAAEKATPGDWRRASTRFNGVTAQASYPLCGKEEILANTSEKRDAEFIAAANPATVLALLDELEALEKRIAELEAREVTLPQVLDVHPLGPQSAKMFWAFKRDVVNECADRIRAAGIRINGEG